MAILVSRVLCSPRYHVSSPEKDRALTTSSVNHQCQRPEGETRADRNKFHFRGTALGGWLVLEPWITPSLFYQFLGASEKWGDEAPDRVGLDSYTFCSGLSTYSHGIASETAFFHVQSGRTYPRLLLDCVLIWYHISIFLISVINSNTYAYK